MIVHETFCPLSSCLFLLSRSTQARDHEVVGKCEAGDRTKRSCQQPSLARVEFENETHINELAADGKWQNNISWWSCSSEQTKDNDECNNQATHYKDWVDIMPCLWMFGMIKFKIEDMTTLVTLRKRKCQRMRIYFKKKNLQLRTMLYS